MKKYFLIAGEASGDLLGSKLMKEIKEAESDAEFIGVGGPLMKEEGLESIFNYEELTIMGFVEILPKIPTILKKIKQTSDEIIKTEPDCVITIDSPDFCFRVIKKIQNISKAKKVHLIAPSVWAYREKRAEKIAKLYDLLLAILPFEPPYFTKYGLKTTFIGHPIIENKPDFSNQEYVNEEFRNKHNLKLDDKIICVTPGSRIGEVTKIYPEFIDAINILQSKYKNIVATIPLTPKTHDIVQEMSKKLKCKYILVNRDKKNLALLSSNYALAKSGTNNLELSLYKIPFIIAYKVNILSYLLGKMLIKIKFVNLVNIILNKAVIPEMIQKDCQAHKLAQKLEHLIENKQSQIDQINLSQEALLLMGLNSFESPSKKAAQEIINL